MFGGSTKDNYDVEQGGLLYPGIGSLTDNEMRWGLIRKVYSIVGTQLLLTAIVASVVVLYQPISVFLLNSPLLYAFIAISPLIVMCPMFIYRDKHPLNLILLGIFTICLSFAVGMACAFTSGAIVLEALILTAVVVLSLTGYTFWAARKGYDFSFLGPFLFTSLVALIVFGFIQVFFPLGPISNMIYGGLGAIIFSGYIIYDTDNLIKRFSYDDYIWASVTLYLDILNLFIILLDLLKSNR